MKKVIALGALLLVGSMVSFSLSAEANEPDGAIVFTHGSGAQCFFFAFGGVYSGPATIVGTPRGKANAQCRATLLSGSPVAEATRVTGVGVLTPVGGLTCSIQLTTTGNAIMNCHR